jgi:hypothetical protein
MHREASYFKGYTRIAMMMELTGHAARYPVWYCIFTVLFPSICAQAQYLSSAFNILDKSYNGQNNRPVQPLLPTTRVYSYGPDPAVA